GVDDRAACQTDAGETRAVDRPGVADRDAGACDADAAAIDHGGRRIADDDATFGKKNAVAGSAGRGNRAGIDDCGDLVDPDPGILCGHQAAGSVDDGTALIEFDAIRDRTSAGDPAGIDDGSVSPGDHDPGKSSAADHAGA